MNFLRDNTCKIGKYLPDFLQHDVELATTLEVESQEHERQRLMLLEMLDQFFVDSATWGLDYWEEVLAVSHSTDETFQQRRQNILLKLQSHQTSTKVFLEKLAERYTSGRVNLQEQNKQNSFRLRCSKIPYDWNGLREAIETYKPAHLSYIIAHYITATANIYAGGCISSQHKKIILGMAGYNGSENILRPLYVAGIVKIYKQQNLKTID